MDLLTVALLVGFAARLTRLVVVDDIAEPLRIGVLRLGGRVGGGRGARWALGLVECPFCIGFWLSVLVVASWAWLGHTVGWRLVAGVFALNYVHGHLNARLDMGADDDH